MPLSLQISARILSWPQECACCGAEPTGHLRAIASRVIGTRIERTTHQWWDVPYCDRCLGHVHMFERSSMWAPLGLVVSTMVAIVAGMYAHPIMGEAGGQDRAVALTAGVAAVAFAVVMCLAYTLHYSARQHSQEQALAHMDKTCAAPHRAVMYTEWYGTMHTLVFEREHYLEAFLSLNGEKTRSAITNTVTGQTLGDPSPQSKRNSSRVRRSSH